MRVDIFHHIEIGPTGLATLDAISRKLDRILEEETAMSKELDDLTAQVHANTDAAAAATALINGIADRITAAGTDATKLAALTAELKASDETLGAAVTANTPAAPPV